MALTLDPSPIRWERVGGWERGTGEVSFQLAERHEPDAAIFAGGDHLVGDEGGRLVGWETAVFLFPLLFIDALGVLPGHPLFRSIVGACRGVDLLDQALRDSGFDGNFMKRPAHGISALLDIAEDLVKDRADAAVSGND